VARRQARAKRKTPHAAPGRRPSPAKQKVSPELRAARNRRIVWTVVIAAIACVVLFFPVALATDRPVFCASCHGMVPFYDAWQVGKHKDVWCIDCHVDQGYPARFLHKFNALQEVYAQFFSAATYPNYNADMPDSRCLRCHPEVPTKVAAVGQFSHQQHLERGVPCAKCHADTGHHVTFAALQQAGVLNQQNVPAGATYVGQEFAGAPGAHSALPGHKPVPCANCHDTANLQCSFCHTPPANHFGANCKSCHKPGVPFAQFQHPPSGEHNYRSRPCVKCHPNGYATVYCTCHKGRPPTGD